MEFLKKIFNRNNKHNGDDVNKNNSNNGKAPKNLSIRQLYREIERNIKLLDDLIRTTNV